MRNFKTAVLLGFTLLIAAAAPARAQGRSGFGVGAETLLTGEFDTYFGNVYPGVATLTWDSGMFQVEGMLLFADVDNGGTLLGLGGRFYYVIHQGDRSDFSVGGGLALVNVNPDGPRDSWTDIHLEGGGRLRAFLTPNVAFTAGVGIGVLMADNDGDNQDAFGLVGQLMGSLGFTYFFW